MNVSINALISDNTRRLDYFLNDKGFSRSSHPVNPIRVQALNLFATTKTQEELHKGMDELISILLNVGDSELDEHMAKFIASAGLIVANLDREVTDKEVDQIIETLANFKIFPRKFLEDIASGDVPEVFNTAVENILRINQGMRDNMLEYMIHIVMSDKKISKAEVDFLYKFGSSVGLSDMEVSTSIAESIQRNYIPSLESIC
jgi:hypothetical protein